MRFAPSTSTGRATGWATGALAALSSAALGAALATAAPATAATASTWAPADTAQIHPGTMMYTDGAQCTANFVYTDSSANVYVGYAAHCAGTGSSTDTDGCKTDSLPLGTKVTFNEGGSLVDEGTQVGSGTLVYSSWLTEKKLGTTDPNTCAYNDLALVKVDAADVSKVNPSVPFWGGPTGIPGDYGAGFMSADVQALGVLSTVALAPLAGSNGVGDLARELAFAQQNSGISGLQLVNGTEPFAP